MMVFAGIFQVAVYFIGTTIPQFYVVLNAKDQPAFWKVVGTLVGLYCIIAAVHGGAIFTSGIFSLKARTIITHRLQDGYVKAGMLYSVAQMGLDGVDNPDQRITQDVDNLTIELRTILNELVIEPILLVYYTYYTFTVSGWIGIGSIYFYFGITTLFCRYALAPLVQLVSTKEKAEGDFRYLHVRLRSQAECVSLLRGQELEKAILNKSFERLLHISRRIVNWESIFDSLKTYLNYFGSVVCYGLVAMPIFEGKYDDLPPGELSALIARHLFFSLYLTFRFNNIARLGEKYANVAGYSRRIAQLLEASTNTENGYSPTDVEQNEISKIVIRDLNFETPSGRNLIRNLSVTIRKGTPLAIMGASGTGKSSLLRVLSGLWKPTHGFISPMPMKYVLFLPQLPYLVSGGNLRDQIAYPDSGQAVSISDQTLSELLNQVGLADLLGRERDRFNAEDWDIQLSPGERQRLAFARVLWRRPTFAFIDEGTCHVDAQLENSLFQAASTQGITCVIVTHRPLAGFHKVLRFLGDGEWIEE
ncbi:ABC transporter transmembrane region 2-domain-containing protein [Phlyctochytrium arcticum]|nr:ABC transporter transmembrane region 2-domain-containing protein [Phlyctochytrium arcticum]